MFNAEIITFSIYKSTRVHRRGEIKSKHFKHVFFSISFDKNFVSKVKF